MLNCPFCGFDLTRASLNGERCPSCGARLIWDDGPGDTEAWSPSPQTDLPRSPVIEDHKPSIKEVLNAFFGRGPAPARQGSGGQQPAGPSASDESPAGDVEGSSASGQAPDTQPQDGDSPPPDSPPRGEHMRSIDPRELSPEQSEQLAFVWQPVIPEHASVQMTLKADAQRTAISGDLVVPPRNLQPAESAALESADYRLLSWIGEGGVGIVHAARQVSINRTVAVKTLKPQIADDPDHRNKFLIEAVVTGDLDHPNIVPIYELGMDQSSALFYSMKRVQGTPWSDVIGSKSTAENLDILMHVADAIAFAHSRGVIHRDLKPENIMLGDFGEVLVMDWGIALSTSAFLKSDSITQSSSMGGTPAYMAPEMATGPLSAIGTHSDIYLLGALLFEIISGHPPHTGNDILQCLRAVARNEIEPTDKSGELLDVAYKAMSTQPQDRYASVQEFQGAIRLYLDHSESIILSQNAAESLSRARQTLDYQDFSRSVFAYEEALAIWRENASAKSGLREAKFAYAQTAYEKSDFDLGQSLLDPADPEHARLLRDIEKAQEERTARQRRLKRARQTVLALAALVFLVVSVSLFFVIDAWQKADESLKSEKEALASKEEARQEAVTAQRDALAEKENALISETKALDAKKEAEDAKEDAEDAQRDAEAASYVAEIGLAADRVGNNAFLDATRLLAAYENGPRADYWEWGHLEYLCRQGQQTLEMNGRIESIACSHDGRFLVVGSSNGQVFLWDRESEDRNSDPGLKLSSHPSPVYAVAISPDGKSVVSGGSETPGEIQVWERTDDGGFRPRPPLVGHETDKGIFSLRFSSDGKRVLSGSEDETARLWDLQQGVQIRDFRGHSRPVYAAGFHPNDSHVVTAGEDGTVRIWPLLDAPADSAGSERSLDTAHRRIRFIGHEGPVYAAAFSPDGRLIASAGRDGRILVWSWPDAVKALAERPESVSSRAMKSQETILEWDGDKVRVFRFENVGNDLTAERDKKLIASRTLLMDGKFTTFHVAASLASSGADELANPTEPGGPSPEQLKEMFTVELKDPGGGTQDTTAMSWKFECDRSAFGDLPTGETVLLTYTIRLSGDRASAPEREDAIEREVSKKVTIEVSKRVDGLVAMDDLDARGLDIGLRVLAGHPAEVRSLTFVDQGEGKRSSLVSCGHDNTVKVWDLQAADDSADQVLTLRGHGGWVRSVVFLPGESSIASGGYDRQLKIWDLGKYEEVKIWGPEDDGNVEPRKPSGNDANEIRSGAAIADASLSADGSHAIMAGEDGIAWVWSIANNQEYRLEETADARLDEGHDFMASSAIFFPRGDHRLLTSAGDGTVRLWNYRTGGQSSCFAGTGSGARMTLSDDSRWLLTGGQNNEVFLWDVQDDQQPLKIFEGHQHEVTAVAISHGGELSERNILTADANGLCRLWRSTTQNEQNEDWTQNEQNEDWECRELTSHVPGERVSAAAFLPDNRRLLTASHDFAVLQWEIPSGKLIEDGTLGHPGAVRAMEMDMSPDGRRVVTVCQASGIAGGQSASDSQYQLSLWDVPNAALLKYRVLTAEMVTSISLSRDARSALVVESVGGETGRVFRWEFDTNRYRPLWSDEKQRGAVWTALESQEPGHVLTVGGSYARLWRDNGELEQSFSRHGALNAAAFAPSGTLAVTADSYGDVKIWNVDEQNASPSVAWKIPAAHGLGRSRHAVNSAVFGPRLGDGDGYLLTAGGDGSARLWKLGNGSPKRLATLSGHSEAVQQAVFSRDGNRVATASSDGTAIIWKISDDLKVTKGETITPEFSSGLGLTCICFSPDSERVVIGSEDNTAEVWDLEGQTTPIPLKGHTASLTAVAFSPDGKRVASGSSDGMARVWDAASGESLLSLQRHTAAVTAVEFSSDGHRILTASVDKTAIVWLADPISPNTSRIEDLLIDPSEEIGPGGDSAQREISPPSVVELTAQDERSKEP